REKNPEYTLLFMPPPAGFEGAPQHNYNGVTIDQVISVASTSPNIEDAMKYMDWLYSDEGAEVTNWGIEGVSYEVVNGQKKVLTEKYPTFSDIRAETGLFNFGSYTRMDSTIYNKA